MSLSPCKDASGSIAKDSSASSNSCIGEIADSTSAPESIFEETFMFTEDLFKQYYLLHLRPHEKGLSLKLIQVAAATFVLCLMFSLPNIVAFPQYPYTFIFTDPSSWSSYQHLMVNSLLVGFTFLFFSVMAAVYGIWLLRGRRPNWGKASWRIRLDGSFGSIKWKKNNSPFDSSIESSFGLIGSTLTMRNSYGDTWADDDRYIRPIWVTSEDIDISLNKPYAVPFAVRIFSDHIERGNKESNYAVTFADYYDVLEHERFPDIAILRSEKYGETVVLKDGFEAAQWSEVRDYIERRISEERKAKKAERRKRLFRIN